MTERAQGIVKFFDTTKGYGFVRRGKGEPDVFVHMSALKRSGINEISKGDKVEFDIIAENGRLRADNVALQP